MTLRNSDRLCRGVLIAAAPLALCVAPAAAHPSYLTAFQARYPGSTLPGRMLSTTGSSCNVCHHPTSTSNPGNCYRETLAGLLGGGQTIDQALANAETLDSDGDGVPNRDEITRPRTDLPGQVGYNPGLIGPTGTDPCGTSTTTPVTNQNETPAAACYANCDGSTIAPILNVSDFSCFLNRFAAGDSYANCDGSTIQPVLNVADFSCFLNRFAAGCS
jgi:hypothetical protein